MKLYAPKEYWESGFKGNGCGPNGFGWAVPDSLIGVRITAACRIHDWMYLAGETESDRNLADRVFLNNMIRIVAHESYFKPLRWLRLKLAYAYYTAVSRFGGPYFWSGKNKPEEMGDVRVERS